MTAKFSKESVCTEHALSPCNSYMLTGLCMHYPRVGKDEQDFPCNCSSWLLDAVWQWVCGQRAGRLSFPCSQCSWCWRLVSEEEETDRLEWNRIRSVGGGSEICRAGTHRSSGVDLGAWGRGIGAGQRGADDVRIDKGKRCGEGVEERGRSKG